MKILFVNLSGLCFTVATPGTEPLGGTESALCYLALELARLGHDVSVIARLPDGAPESIGGVRHYLPSVLLNGDFLAAQDFDVIVVNNRPVAGPSLREMAPRALLLLWNHVMPEQPAMVELRRDLVRQSFDHIVYVSDWQRQVTEKNYGFEHPHAVIGNGFAPAFAHMFLSADALLAAKQNLAAYMTTPFRGLDILLESMRGLDTGTRLDLYSSMKVYQLSGEGDRYGALYERAAQNPLVTMHGSVGQNELARRLRPAAFFAYPSTYAETFCIAAIEALAAGMGVLTTSTGALPEVLGHDAAYVELTSGQPEKLAADFRDLMRNGVAKFREEPQGWAQERFQAMQRVNRECSWAVRAKSWELFFGEHLRKH